MKMIWLLHPGLKYMNEALDFMKTTMKLLLYMDMSTHSQGLKEVFFIKGADCWGWATWKAWDLFEHDGAKLLEKSIHRDFRKFDFDNTYPYIKALEQQAVGNTTHWDIRWYASAFLAKLTLYPGQSW
ncbi:hypothetical protein CS542_00825 [Pedobacter sp. IW39]|nr:hypothetical protein CS542_00825 [Pedobacter sp. IW39]